MDIHQPPGPSPQQALPPPPEPQRWTASSGLRAARGAGGLAIGIGLAVAKFKFLLLLLLQFKWVLVGVKLLLSFGTFFLSIAFYAYQFGWKLAVAFVVLLAIHELGHYAVIRSMGMSASLPYFIPGFGAVTVSNQRAESAFAEAWIACGGPFVGSLGAVACWLLGSSTHQPFLLAAAYIGFWLNLFNLIPLYPLDGGRIVGAVSPRVWIAGLVLFIGYLFVAHAFNPITVLIVLVLVVPSFGRIIGAWRGGPVDPYYAMVTPTQRAIVAAAYFALIAALAFGLHFTQPPTHESVLGYQ